MDITEHIWKHFAQITKGEYITGHYGESDKVKVNYQDWTIIFDIYIYRTTVGNLHMESHFTRVRSPFIPKDKLKFQIFRKGLISSISKLFGSKDIPIRFHEFDKAFIIKGNDEIQIRELFSNSKLRNLLEAQGKFHLEVIDSEGTWGEKVDASNNELYFWQDGAINDIRQLESLFELFRELLTQLDRIGSIGKSSGIS